MVRVEQLAELIAPERTALVTVEVQDGVVGEGSLLPALAEAAAPILPRIATLAAAARDARVTVVHCTVDHRTDGKGANRNARVFGVGGGPARSSLNGELCRATVHAGVGPDPADLVLGRLHGVSPMTATSLDPILRNLGVTTIVATGVSVNIALLGLAFEAVNHGYQVVVPRDAVAGVDDAYVEAVFAGTLSLLATLTDADTVVAAWRHRGTSP